MKNNLWRITLDTNPEDCNLACIMCEEHSPYSKFKENLYKTTGIRKRRMPIEWIENIFMQAEKIGVKEIIPSTMGEPLLYDGMERIFELSKLHGIKINLTTNGTFPRKGVAKWAELIVPNTTDVKISWNGSTAATSEAVMKKIKFEKALDNVRQFIKYRDTYYQETGIFCRVTFQLTFMQNNMQELAGIVKLAAELGVDRVKGHQLWDHFDEIKNLSFRRDEASAAKWNEYVKQALEAKEKYLKPNGEKVILENIIPLPVAAGSKIPESYACPFLNKEIWISAEGKISPCCAPDEQRKSLGDFGNIETSTLDEVMNSPEYLDLERSYKTKTLCKSCNMRKPQ